MKVGESLMQKDLFLVLLPLTFQLSVLGGLIYLQTAAEEVAAGAELAAKIDENINYLVKVLLKNNPRGNGILTKIYLPIMVA
jgi:hypothetical protein